VNHTCNRTNNITGRSKLLNPELYISVIITPQGLDKQKHSKKTSKTEKIFMSQQEQEIICKK
jgi:hypothetical protein